MDISKLDFEKLIQYTEEKMNTIKIEKINKLNYSYNNSIDQMLVKKYLHRNQSNFSRWKFFINFTILAIALIYISYYINIKYLSKY